MNKIQFILYVHYTSIKLIKKKNRYHQWPLGWLIQFGTLSLAQQWPHDLRLELQGKSHEMRSFYITPVRHKKYSNKWKFATCMRRIKGYVKDVNFP